MMKRPCGVLAAFTVAALAGALPLPAAAADPGKEVGAATRVVRDVFGTNLNRKMAEGETLIFNQMVRTGADSAAELALIDRSHIAVGERAEIKIDEFVIDGNALVAKGAINVTRGALRFVSATLTLDVKVKTPTATMGIRGTIFDLNVTGQSTEVAVHEGAVAIESPFGNRTVNPGEVVRVSPASGLAAGTKPSPELAAALVKMFVSLQVPADQYAQRVRALDAKTAAKAASAPAAARDHLALDLAKGRIVIKLRPDLAPKNVAQIKALAERGFYDGLVFHSVVNGGVAVTGDPTATGQSGSGRTLPLEASRETFKRGSVGMVQKRGDPASADSQFFICLAPQPHLDGKYTYIGEIVRGFDVVEKLARGTPPKPPDRLVKARLAADASG
jgi:peptidylprolyl isomerase